jgi:hypothetical protein
LDSDPAPPALGFSGSASDDKLIKVTVTVRWSENKTYSATGVVANSLP